MKRIIQDLNFAELTALTQELGEQKYRAGQLYRGIMRGSRISDISDLSKSFREKLLERFEDEPVRIREAFSSSDGAEKYLFELSDGNLVEGVLMSYKYGRTQCVSTQVGCRMNCAFCASGLHFLRDLTAGEILAQVLAVNARAGGTAERRAVTNVVLMGSGEPLDNYDNTIRFLRNVTAEGGICISPRNISLSTCGLVPAMYRLADEGIPLNLTVSLHAADDEERARIMPVAKVYKIADILAACENYFEKTGRRYIFEYSLIAGENTSREHAEALIRLLRGRPCHVNLIRLNEVKERGLRGIGEKEAYRFLGMLEKGGLSATLRRTIGADVGGACGQLRASYLKEE